MLATTLLINFQQGPGPEATYNSSNPAGLQQTKHPIVPAMARYKDVWAAMANHSALSLC